MRRKYAVVKVDEDNVRMSSFIAGKLKCQFEDGKAFYEATENEDFLHYRKILRPENKGEVNFFYYACKYSMSVRVCMWKQCKLIYSYSLYPFSI